MLKMLYKIALICLLNAAIAHSYSIGSFACEYPQGSAHPLGFLSNVRNCKPAKTEETSVLLNKIFNTVFEESKESEEAVDRRFNEIDWKPTSYDTASAEAKMNAKLGVALDTIKSDIYAIRESMSYMELLTQKLFGSVERQHEKAEKPYAEQTEVMDKLALIEQKIEYLTEELFDMRAEAKPSSTTPTATVDSDSASKEDVDADDDDDDVGISHDDELERKWREILNGFLIPDEEISKMIITRDPANINADEDQENNGDDNDDDDDDADIMSTTSPYTFSESHNKDADGDNYHTNNDASGEIMDTHGNKDNDDLHDFDYMDHVWDKVTRGLEPEPEADSNDYVEDDEYDEWQ